MAEGWKRYARNRALPVMSTYKRTARPEVGGEGVDMCVGSPPTEGTAPKEYR